MASSREPLKTDLPTSLSLPSKTVQAPMLSPMSFASSPRLIAMLSLFLAR